MAAERSFELRPIAFWQEPDPGNTGGGSVSKTQRGIGAPLVFAALPRFCLGARFLFF